MEVFDPNRTTGKLRIINTRHFSIVFDTKLRRLFAPLAYFKRNPHIVIIRSDELISSRDSSSHYIRRADRGITFFLNINPANIFMIHPNKKTPKKDSHTVTLCSQLMRML